MNNVYLISNVEEFGKLVAFCIYNDICVFRLYWNEFQKGNICYEIDYRNKRCYQGRKQFYLERGDKIKIPIFETDNFGNFKLMYKLVEE